MDTKQLLVFLVVMVVTLIWGIHGVIRRGNFASFVISIGQIIIGVLCLIGLIIGVMRGFR